MADYHTQFSVQIPCTKVQWEALETAVSALKETDDDWASPDHCEYSDGGVWLAGESGLEEGFIDLLRNWQKTQGIPPFGIEMSSTCSKLRLDSFGGHALLFHNGQVEYFSTSEWLAEQIELVPSPTPPGALPKKGERVWYAKTVTVEVVSDFPLGEVDLLYLDNLGTCPGVLVNTVYGGERELTALGALTAIKVLGGNPADFHLSPDGVYVGPVEE